MICVCWLLSLFLSWCNQRAVLDPAMEGRDLIARAKTGTGKTLAFGIPIIHNILKQNEKDRTARFAPLDQILTSNRFISSDANVTVVFQVSCL